VSKALNETALQAQEAIRGGILSRFTVRRQDFILRTVKIFPNEFATKSNFKAIVRIDPSRNFLAPFEHGGTKKPLTGNSLALPDAVRDNKTDVIPRAMRPKGLRLRITQTRSGKTQVKGAKRTFLIPGFGIMQRIGGRRGYGGPRASNVLVLYRFRSSVRLSPMLRFEATARQVAAQNFDGNLARSINFAIATAR
jgi:hypothetical protein